MLHKEIPFLRLGLPLCAGIISGLYIAPDRAQLLGFISFALLLFLISLAFNKHQSNQIYGYAISLSLFICGLVLYTIEKGSITKLNSQETVFTCRLNDFPEEKEKSIRIEVELLDRITGSTRERVRGSMILYNKKDISNLALRPGDLLTIRCKPVEITNRGNPYEFNYRFYMENQGIKYFAFTSAQNILGHAVPVHRKLIHKALIIRADLIKMYRERGLSGDNLAVVVAITLGQKELLEPDQKQSFIKAGVIHIMAVSGLHAVILSMFVFNLLFFMKKRLNPLRILIAVIFLWLFAFVTGLTASVLRAALMFSFIQAGKLMKRPPNSINSVLASAFILLVIKPSFLFNTGFLLSYSAVIYIIVFYRDLYEKLHFNKWLPDKIWQASVITILAQAGTLPITITFFNRFPVYFLITNIIIVPLASAIIIMSCLVLLTYHVAFLSKLLASLLIYLTEITQSLTNTVATMPYSSIESIGMSMTECISLIITIFIFTFYFLKKRAFSPVYPLTVLIIFLAIRFKSDLSTIKSNELIVFNTPGSSTIGIRKGATLNIYSDTSSVRNEVLKVCSSSHLKMVQHKLDSGSYLILCNEKRIIISDSFDNSQVQKEVPDILILYGNNPFPGEKKHVGSTPEVLILNTGSIPIAPKVTQMLSSLPDSIHIVSRNGAFMAKL